MTDKTYILLGDEYYNYSSEQYVAVLNAIDNRLMRVDDFDKIDFIMQVALYNNRCSVVNKILDNCNTPTDLNYKQRLTYYELLNKE